MRPAALLLILVVSLASSPPAAHGNPPDHVPTVTDPLHDAGGPPAAYCDSCPDPTVNVFGVEFRRGELWVLGTDGTLTRLSGCSPAGVISVQGFRGFATSLGYDAGRDEFIVADLKLGQIDVVDPTGRLVRSFPAPSTGLVGVTYDPTRDVYWIIDSDTDSLYALNAVGGGRVATFKLPTCTLCQGAAYDPALDAVYYSDPAVFIDGQGGFTTRYYYISCATGALLGASPLQYTSILEWKDNAIGPDGSLWIHNINWGMVYCMERQSTPARRATWGQLKLRYR